MLLAVEYLIEEYSGVTDQGGVRVCVASHTS